jgi:hypothetical protein
MCQGRWVADGLTLTLALSPGGRGGKQIVAGRGGVGCRRVLEE